MFSCPFLDPQLTTHQSNRCPFEISDPISPAYLIVTQIYKGQLFHHKDSIITCANKLDYAYIDFIYGKEQELYTIRDLL
jgi:hypothetical protein